MKNAKCLMKKLILQTLAIALPLALATTAHAASIATTDNNFTMLTGKGDYVGRDSNVSFTWDGTFNTSVSSAVPNATFSSPNVFFGVPWSTHNVSIYGPGAYTVYSGCTGNPSCGSGIPINFTVAPDQVGVHMLFDWGAYRNTDVVNVWNLNALGLPSRHLLPLPSGMRPHQMRTATVLPAFQC